MQSKFLNSAFGFERPKVRKCIIYDYIFKKYLHNVRSNEYTFIQITDLRVLFHGK